MVTTYIASNSGSYLVTRRFTVNYSEITAAALVKAWSLFTLPAGGKILGVEIKHSTAFSGGAVSAATVSVGVATEVARYAAAFNIFQAVADTTLQETTEFKSGQRTAASVIAYFTTVGANISALTAGVVEITVTFLNVSTP
jgi:hypothetical protein